VLDDFLPVRNEFLPVISDFKTVTHDFAATPKDDEKRETTDYTDYFSS
jgi:hypothetical protein